MRTPRAEIRKERGLTATAPRLCQGRRARRPRQGLTGPPGPPRVWYAAGPALAILPSLPLLQHGHKTCIKTRFGMRHDLRFIFQLIQFNLCPSYFSVSENLARTVEKGVVI